MSDPKLNRLPLWRSVAEKLITDGLAYGQRITAAELEEGLKEVRTSPAYAFAVMALRQYIEDETGLYLQSIENGNCFVVPSAPGHEQVAAMMDRKVRRYAVRSVNVRSATLMSPAAELTAQQRATMERNLEHASLRLVLMSRAASFADLAGKHHPKLLTEPLEPAAPDNEKDQHIDPD